MKLRNVTNFDQGKERERERGEAIYISFPFNLSVYKYILMFPVT